MKRNVAKYQKAIEVARVLKVEIAGLTDIDQSARRQMLDVLDGLIAALQDDAQ